MNTTEEAVARLLGRSRSTTTDKGLAKDIRTVLDALAVAEAKVTMAYERGREDGARMEATMASEARQQAYGEGYRAMAESLPPTGAPLDPHPWTAAAPEGVVRKGGRIRLANLDHVSRSDMVFSPRPGYEQDVQKYDAETRRYA